MEEVKSEIRSPEPHHWRSSSDEPEKPTISTDS